MGGLGPFALNYHSIQELLSYYYGGVFITQPHDKDFTVGTSVVTLDPARNLAPTDIYISNTGATNIYISFNPAMTTPNGILLETGGFMRLQWRDDGDLIQKPLYAIGSAGGGTLHVIWRMLVGG